MKSIHLSPTKLFLNCILLLCCFYNLPAIAESPFLTKGIRAYTVGDYKKAAGLFGGAQSAEFDNPILHYYFANTLIHLNEREGAIKEYRIAYALDPDGDVGRQCRLALSAYGADLFNSKRSRSGKDNAPGLGKITFSSDPVIQQAVVAMHRQVDQLASTYNTSPSNIYGRNIGVLRKAWGWQRQFAENSAHSTSAAIESANNLEKLMNNNGSSSKVRLDPSGTNLYIRKYSYPGSDTSTNVRGNLVTSPSGQK